MWVGNRVEDIYKNRIPFNSNVQEKLKAIR